MFRSLPHPFVCIAALAVAWALTGSFDASATPANKAALVKHYAPFLPKALNRCSTCHLPSDNKAPDTLEEFPHNAFGDRLRKLGEAAAKKADIPRRLQGVAREDADQDGADNETELLLGRNPGDERDAPSPAELAAAQTKRAQFAKMLAAYRWQPFEPVKRPAVPEPRDPRWGRNPIDAFIAREHEVRKLAPRPEAAKATLLRRVYLDLIGLTPTPGELRAFLADASPDAYDRVVDRLLERPQYGERWARHWMDIWRYSDWTGYQGVPRDSKPHIWRWRDWIIEALNAGRGYDRMVMEMIAADEIAPTDDAALRATGFLARNFKSLSRERWLEDTISHTFQAFQGITLNCAKCHDHMYDPISQREYFEVRAIFEPHNLRTDRVPGVIDTDKDGDGLVRAYDAALAAKTYVLQRGDERKPLKDIAIEPNLPRIFDAHYQPKPVSLPIPAVRPHKRDFVIRDDLAAAEQTVRDARVWHAAWLSGKPAQNAKAAAGKAARRAPAEAAKLPFVLKPLPPAKTMAEAERNVALAEARLAAFKATLAAEALEHDKRAPAWQSAARAAALAHHKLAQLESQVALNEAAAAMKTAGAKAEKDAKGGDKGIAVKSAAAFDAAKKAYEAAQKAMLKAAQPLETPVPTIYPALQAEEFPATSTGRRLALAQWLASPRNPLTARVAVNHIWARHFGRGLVPTPNDFGRSGQPPSHPSLLDWLAAEFMSPSGRVAGAWDMKHLHRLIVTSSTYRMASTTDAANAERDKDNVFLWRTPSRRMEAEAVRDNILHAAGSLDLAMGGPEIDNTLGLVSKRRSVYLRIAPEKEVEFIKIFDGPNPVECYSRPVTVAPHQALALANSELVFNQAKLLTLALTQEIGNDRAAFIQAAYERILARSPTAEEAKLCAEFLADAVATPATPPAGGAPSVAPATPQPHSSSEPGLRARQNLVMVLFNHNDFVTVR